MKNSQRRGKEEPQPPLPQWVDEQTPSQLLALKAPEEEEQTLEEEALETEEGQTLEEETLEEAQEEETPEEEEGQTLEEEEAL